MRIRRDRRQRTLTRTSRDKMASLLRAKSRNVVATKATFRSRRTGRQRIRKRRAEIRRRGTLLAMRCQSLAIYWRRA
jgi:hypothetical protein